MTALRKHRAAQKKERLFVGGGWVESGQLFTTATGGVLHPRNVLQAFDGLVAKAGVPDITMHDLRHTAASLALRAAVHPKLVQEMLGHARFAITLDLYPTWSRRCTTTPPTNSAACCSPKATPDSGHLREARQRYNRAAMATAPEHLTPEQEQREREHAASFHAARRLAGDPKFMSSMNERLEVLNRTTRPTTMTREEFLAYTETSDV